MFRISQHATTKITRQLARLHLSSINIQQQIIENPAIWRILSSMNPILQIQYERCSHNININTGYRYYSTDNKKPQKPFSKVGDVNRCKPSVPKECRKEPPPACDPAKKPMPSMQKCTKPNLMSDCPKPDCPHEPTDSSRYWLWLGLFLTAAAFGAYWVLQEKPTVQPSSQKPVKITKKKKLYVPKRVPELSKDIPSSAPYLLIGGGTASFAAFRAIKSSDPEARVLVITNEEFTPYMRPPLSKEMWQNAECSIDKLDFKQWSGSERSLLYEPHDFYLNTSELSTAEHGGVAVARGWTVTHLDVLNKKAVLDDGYEIEYNKCLIATGAKPKNLDIFESANDSKITNRIAVFRTIIDYLCVCERAKEAKSVAIIGGGFLGSELACALGRRFKDKQINQIFKEGGVMAHVLPEYLSFWATETVRKEGVNIIENSEVIGVSASNENVTLTTNRGKTVTADLVLVCIGAAPNTDMAGASDLETDPDYGGYLVNTELQARSNLYVAGDAASFFDPLLGRRRIQHHENAIVSGRLAGENMTGAGKPYVHQSTFWSDLGPEIGYEAIGIVDSTLPTVGVFVKQNEAEDCDKEEIEAAAKVGDVVPEQCLRFVDQDVKDKQEMSQAELKAKEQERLEKLQKRKDEAAAKKKHGEDYSKGVIFYLKDDIVVGIVTWNVFNRMKIARKVLADQKKYDDLNEVAKLFRIHEDVTDQSQEETAATAEES